MKKCFLYFSAGSTYDPDDGCEPYLHIQSHLLEEKLTLVLQGLSWLKPEEYMPFIENAKVGDMIVLKKMIGLVRLRYPKKGETCGEKSM